jgi:hypothetical protein
VSISPSIAEPDDVQWTHDGFEVHLYDTDSAYPDRMALLGGLLGASSACPVAALLTALDIPDPMNVVFLTGVWLLIAVFMVGALGRGLARTWRSRARNLAVLSASSLRWTSPAGIEHGVALEAVTGLRVRGPRPWRLVIEHGRPERQTELSCGMEAHAHWLGAQVARQVVAFHEKAGSADAVPNAIRALSQQGRAISRVRS